MYRKTLLFLLCACMLFSCNKAVKPHPCNCPAPVFKPNANVPYDTSGVVAIFAVQVVHDSSRNPVTDNGFVMAFFTHNALPAIAKTGTITLNGSDTSDNPGMFYIYAYSKQMVDSMQLIKPLSWAVTKTNIYDLSYIDTGAFPVNTINFPNKIDYTTTFSFSFDSVTNADTILVSISSPQSVDYPMDIHMEYHDSVSHFWAGNTNKSITIPANAISKFKNQDCIANISFFHHEYVVRNGQQYLFIKQYSFNKKVRVE